MFVHAVCPQHVQALLRLALEFSLESCLAGAYASGAADRYFKGANDLPEGERFELLEEPDDTRACPLPRESSGGKVGAFCLTDEF